MNPSAPSLTELSGLKPPALNPSFTSLPLGEEKSSSSTWLWVLVGVLFLLCLLAAGGTYSSSRFRQKMCRTWDTNSPYSCTMAEYKTNWNARFRPDGKDLWEPNMPYPPGSPADKYFKQNKLSPYNQETLHKEELKEFSTIMKQVVKGKCNPLCKLLGKDLYEELTNVARDIMRYTSATPPGASEEEKETLRQQFGVEVGKANKLYERIQKHVKNRKNYGTRNQLKQYEAFEYGFKETMKQASIFLEILHHAHSTQARCDGASSQEQCQNISAGEVVDCQWKNGVCGPVPSSAYSQALAGHGSMGVGPMVIPKRPVGPSGEEAHEEAYSATMDTPEYAFGGSDPNKYAQAAPTLVNPEVCPYRAQFMQYGNPTKMAVGSVGKVMCQQAPKPYEE